MRSCNNMNNNNEKIKLRSLLCELTEGCFSKIAALSAFASFATQDRRAGIREDSNDSHSSLNIQLGEYYLNLWIFI